jgi:hypothetical protein
MSNQFLHVFGRMAVANIIKEQQHKRKPIFINLDEAKSVCIIYNQNRKDDIPLIQKYLDYLHEWKKNVVVVSFSSDETLAKNDLRQFVTTPKQLQWNGLPNTEHINQLLQTSFDILIDLNFDNLISLEFLALKIQAKMKITNDRDLDIPYHDLYILTKNEDGVKVFFREMDKYLGSIQMKKAS